MNPIAYWVRRVREIDDEVASIHQSFEELKERVHRAEADRAEDPTNHMKWGRVFGALDQEQRRLRSRLNTRQVEKGQKLRKLHDRMETLSPHECALIKLALRVQAMSDEERSHLSSEEQELLKEWELFANATPPPGASPEEDEETESFMEDADPAPHHQATALHEPVAPPKTDEHETPPPPHVPLPTPQELQNLLPRLTGDHIRDLTLGEIEKLMNFHERLSRRATSAADLHTITVLDARLSVVANLCQRLAKHWSGQA